MKRMAYLWQSTSRMRAKNFLKLSPCLLFCLSLSAFAAQVKATNDSPASQCSIQLGAVPSTPGSAAPPDLAAPQSQVEILKLSVKPRFFSPGTSHLDLKIRVGRQKIHFSKVIKSDDVSKKEATKQLMAVALNYRNLFINHNVFLSELQNFSLLNTILLSSPEAQLGVDEGSSNTLGPRGLELIELDLEISQIHNRLISMEFSEIDPEALGELLLLVTRSKDLLMSALKNLTEVQINFRLSEIQQALDQIPPFLQSDFSKELIEFLKADPGLLVDLLREGPDRSLLPWTIGLQHLQDRLFTALSYEILANRPQKLKFIEVFGAPEPEDEY